MSQLKKTISTLQEEVKELKEKESRREALLRKSISELQSKLNLSQLVVTKIKQQKRIYKGKVKLDQISFNIPNDANFQKDLKNVKEIYGQGKMKAFKKRLNISSAQKN